MSEGPRLTVTAESLRRSFDRSFAEAPPAAAEPAEDFLAIHAGAEAYAVRLGEIAGLYVDRPIVALPGPLPELLGLVGIRGSVRPVYDLAALLGHAPGGAGRWLLLTGRNEVIALACSAFDGHVRLPRREVVRQEGGHPLRPHLREVVRVGDGVRPIINLASLVEALTQRVRGIAPLKEP
jgi:chemotaxis signal transduction protein